ncbi:MAG: cofactor-independent phosphoglycerate mutase, partial [Planctomycetales bacterium]
GVIGRADNVPAQFTPGSDVANLSLFGYDPEANFTGRAPIEAAAQGIEMAPEDWAIRCNLVTVTDQIMRDFTAGHVSSEEAKELLASAQQELGGETMEFIPGVSYRNLLMYRGGGSPAPFDRESRSTPPHDLTDQTVIDDYPRGPGSRLLTELMDRSLEIFKDHPVNVARRNEGKAPATNLWLWGIGRMPSLAPFAELHGGTRGAMITAVDLLRGLASLIGWPRIEAPGATGYTDTDYASKGRCAVEAIADPNIDLICVHVEATDEASHEGDLDAKIQALEEIDRHVVGPVHEALEKSGDYRLLVLPDHPTLIRTKTHSHGFVPLTFCGTDVNPDEAAAYDEVIASQSPLAFPQGWKMMSHFLGESSPD